MSPLTRKGPNFDGDAIAESALPMGRRSNARRSAAKVESMTTKELINTEIEKLSEDELTKVYGVVKSLAESKASEQRPTLMSRLKRIQIEAPEDFAANLDLYASGEKRVQ